MILSSLTHTYTLSHAHTLTPRRIGGHGTDAVSCGSLNNIYAGSLKSMLLLKFIIDSWVLKRMQNVIGVSFYFLLSLTHLMSPTMTESM